MINLNLLNIYLNNKLFNYNDKLILNQIIKYFLDLLINYFISK